MGADAELEPHEFRRRLMQWYEDEARVLPWRGTGDAYRIWVSEIMLQQTRVAAVIAHYNEFLERFPTLLALSLAPEADVLAVWSGLGYYRRARMLHKAAKFIVLERDGGLPTSSTELRTLPGIGEYTAAAIASIAFGEPVAVVDGNVERVILRLLGLGNGATAAVRARVKAQAQLLIPESSAPTSLPTARRRGGGLWSAEERIALAAKSRPHEAAGGKGGRAAKLESNPAGDHNQAMMELGAMVCLPRAPLCEQCPVYALCRTRGEHETQPRAPQRSQQAAYLLDMRKDGTATEILLSLRPADASIMPAMFELPSLPLEAVEGRESALRVRHSITNTNYYVQVYVPQRNLPSAGTKRLRGRPSVLRARIAKGTELHWVNVMRLSGLPLTGLARKVLQRLKIMATVRMNVLE